MAQKPILKKPEPLTAAIISYMKPGEERTGAQCAGLRVRCLASGQKVFFYRYRGRDRALREIRLGQVWPLTLAKARDAALRKRLERDQGIDPQLEKRKQKEEAARARVAQRQAVELLKSRQEMDKLHVFPSTQQGRHVAQKALGYAQYYARQGDGDEPAADPIEVPWTVHDLRRTVATGLAKLDCPCVVQDRILNHVDSSVSAIYDRHHYDAEARTWLQKWADYLEALTASNVVPLRAA